MLFLLIACDSVDQSTQGAEKALDVTMLAQLQLTEVMQKPMVGKPWVEIYNSSIYDLSTNNVVLYLYGDDGQGGSHLISDPISMAEPTEGLLEPGEHFAVDILDPGIGQATKIALAIENQFDIDGMVVNETEEGISTQRSLINGAYTMDSWCATTETEAQLGSSTPDAPNGVCPQDVDEDCSIYDLDIDLDVFSTNEKGEWGVDAVEGYPVVLNIELKNLCDKDVVYGIPGDGCLPTTTVVTNPNGGKFTKRVRCDTNVSTEWTFGADDPNDKIIESPVRLDLIPLGDLTRGDYQMQTSLHFGDVDFIREYGFQVY